MAEAAQKSSTAKSSTAIKATTLGKQAKSDLPKEIFSEPFHEALVHEAARADLAARRRGTHSSLTRGEVAMTTAKAWRQKGTGRARAGALSVPHRYGGGAAFGPKPRHYTVKVNRKARRKALRAALRRACRAGQRRGPGRFHFHRAGHEAGCQARCRSGARSRRRWSSSPPRRKPRQRAFATSRVSRLLWRARPALPT